MKSFTKIVGGLLGTTCVGITSYYLVVSNPKEPLSVPTVVEKPITNPEHDTVATAKIVQDRVLSRSSLEDISDALGIYDEEFSPTETPGVYKNSTKDKLLVVREDVWKTLINKVQKKFPDFDRTCTNRDEIPDLSEYQFVGLLKYLANQNDTKTTIAYDATEIRRGNSYRFAGGDICCDCDGESLVPQQVDAVIIK